MYLFIHTLVAGPASLIFGDHKVCGVSVFVLFTFLDLPAVSYCPFVPNTNYIIHLFCCDCKGSCVLFSENLSWSYFNYNRNCSGGCYFKKIWKETCLLRSCNAMLDQWLLLCQYQYVPCLKFNFLCRMEILLQMCNCST